MSIKYLTLPLIILTLAFSACACTVAPVPVLEQNPPPLAPTATPLPEQMANLIVVSPTPSSLVEATEPAEWQSITPPDESVTFEIPATWRHFGQDTNWSPDEGSTLLGLRMGWNRPGQAIEAGLLPEGAKILESETEMINEASVRRFRVEAAGVYETHLILVRADSMVFDFLLRASTEAEIDALYPVLVHAVETAQFP